MCCLSRVSKASNSELLMRSCDGVLERRGDGSAVGTSEEMLGCVWAKNLELKNASDFITLPETSHGRRRAA